MFRPEASPLKGLTSAYGQPEARLPHSFTRAFLRFEKSQDFCSAENLIYLAVTSAFRLDNLNEFALLLRRAPIAAVARSTGRYPPCNKMYHSPPFPCLTVVGRERRAGRLRK